MHQIADANHGRSGRSLRRFDQHTGCWRPGASGNRARGNGHRIAATLDELAELAPLDTVTMFRVLEHVADPSDLLRRAVALLRPGGVVLCETWDLESWTARLAGRRWQQLSAPSVLWLFSRGTTDRILAAQDRRLQSWRISAKIVGLGTMLGQLSITGGARPAAGAFPIPSTTW